MTAKLHGGDIHISPSLRTSESFVEAHGVFSSQDLSSMFVTKKANWTSYLSNKSCPAAGTETITQL